MGILLGQVSDLRWEAYPSMNIFIRCIDQGLLGALRSRMSADTAITIQEGDILQSPVDAVVSPANSFGFMDGGIDLVYSQRFGWHVQAAVQAAIKSLPFGELLVGHALSVHTGSPQATMLICAPTMRVPMPIPAINAYLATRAAVHEAIRLGVATLAMPGMGTGAGRIPPTIGAQAMHAGIKDGLAGSRSFPSSWRQAYEWQAQLNAGVGN